MLKELSYYSSSHLSLYSTYRLLNFYLQNPIFDQISVRYCMVCASVREDNPRALVSGLSRTDAKPYAYFIIARACICTLCIAIYFTFKHWNIVLGMHMTIAHGDLCMHLGIDSSTDLDDRYSNLFLNAYIFRHSHTEYLKMI